MKIQEIRIDSWKKHPPALFTGVFSGFFPPSTLQHISDQIVFHLRPLSWSQLEEITFKSQCQTKANPHNCTARGSSEPTPTLCFLHVKYNIMFLLLLFSNTFSDLKPVCGGSHGLRTQPTSQHQAQLSQEHLQHTAVDSGSATCKKTTNRRRGD